VLDRHVPPFLPCLVIGWDWTEKQALDELYSQMAVRLKCVRLMCVH
jgi:hypothetical protein